MIGMRTLAVWALLLLVPAPALAGPITLDVSVDTLSLVGISGSLDLQFNPSSEFAQAATATVSSFQTNGSVGAPILETGGASGLLPSTVVIDNTAVPTVSLLANELQQGFTYGTFFTFVLSISGDAVDHPNNGSESSTFALFLLDGDNNPLLADGPQLTIDLNPDGSTTITTIPAITVTAPVPEPSALALLALGLGGLAGYRFRDSQRLAWIRRLSRRKS